MRIVHSADGTPIAFDRAGSGPALVLVTGALHDAAAVAQLGGVLARHFTVYRYDRRGRGASGDRPRSAPAREVEDLAALLGAAGGGAFAYGHSSGAVLALEAAAAGLAFQRLACYEPPYILPGSRRPVPADLTARIEEAVAAGRPDRAVRWFLLEATGLPRPLVDRLPGSPAWPDLLALAHTLPYDLALVQGGLPPPERLAGLRLPVLALGGSDSPSWTGLAAEALARGLPCGAHRTLPGQRHNPETAPLAAVLEEFFLTG